MQAATASSFYDKDDGLVHGWQGLVTLCESYEEDMGVGTLLQFELLRLKNKLMDTKDSNEAARLITTDGKGILSYYQALRSQQRRAVDAA